MSIREILGWIICGVGSLCALKFMAAAARHRPPLEFDNRSVFESEYDHHQRVAKDPQAQFYLWIGLALLFLGMYLIGMFG
jgi:hypothetical protein